MRDIEGLGEVSVVDGEREKRALDVERLHDATGTDVDGAVVE